MANGPAPEQSALEHAQGLVRFLIALATGAIGFSVTLVDREALSDSHALLVGWVALGVSVLCGILAYSRTVVMLSDRSFDLEDAYLKWPGRIQQGAFLAGIAALSFCLLLVSQKPGEGESKASAAEALAGLASSIRGLSAAAIKIGAQEEADRAVLQKLEELDRAVEALERRLDAGSRSPTMPVPEGENPPRAVKEEER